ncbi:hypothetical protein D3C74_74790 [compost metagenome]
MLLVGLVLFVAALCILIDWKKLRQESGVWDIIIYAVVMLSGIVLTSCVVMGITLPSPLYIIKWLYTPLNSWVNMLFKAVGL